MLFKSYERWFKRRAGACKQYMTSYLEGFVKCHMDIYNNPNNVRSFIDKDQQEFERALTMVYISELESRGVKP